MQKEKGNKKMNERRREEFIQLLGRSNPKSVSQTIQNVGAPISDDDTGYMVDKMSFIDGDTVRDVVLHTMRPCDCGALLTAESPAFGHCQHDDCDRYLCEQCRNQCKRCLAYVCSRHSSRYLDGTVYCHRCRPVKWAKKFFCIRDKVEEK